MGTQPGCLHTDAHRMQIAGAAAIPALMQSSTVAKVSCVRARSSGIVVHPYRMHSSYAFCGRIFHTVSSYTFQSSWNSVEYTLLRNQ